MHVLTHRAEQMRLRKDNGLGSTAPQQTSVQPKMLVLVAMLRIHRDVAAMDLTFCRTYPLSRDSPKCSVSVIGIFGCYERTITWRFLGILFDFFGPGRPLGVG